jgi:hypothetical protein
LKQKAAAEICDGAFIQTMDLAQIKVGPVICAPPQKKVGYNLNCKFVYCPFIFGGADSDKSKCDQTREAIWNAVKQKEVSQNEIKHTFQQIQTLLKQILLKQN